MSDLIFAVREGNLVKVRQLINSSIESIHSAEYANGYVLLLHALETKHTEIAKLLLIKGVRVNAKNKKRVNTALHLAVRNGGTEIVKMLLSRGACMEAKDCIGDTPFHDAIVSKNIEIIELFLIHRPDVSAGNNKGETPLHKASRYGYLHIVEKLLNHGAYINSTTCSGDMPLHYAVQTNNPEITNLLLRNNANANARGMDDLTPLHIAAQLGYVQIAEDLLNHGACTNSVCTSGIWKGRTPLHFATEKRYEAIVKLLLEHGANVNTEYNDGGTPLHFATKNGDEAIVKLLLEHGANVNTEYNDGRTPLHFATENGYEAIVKLLLEHGANVNTEYNDGKTILHLAAQKGYSKIVEYILEYCPDVNNKSNNSSINAAVQRYGDNYGRIVNNLLKYGLTLATEDGSNCLLAATENGHLKIVEELLKSGADVNMLYNLTSKKAYTLLHIATTKNQEEVAKLLIQYGADVNAKDEAGETPIFYATKLVDLKIATLLLTNGANIKDYAELLNRAVEEECREMVEEFLQQNVDINAVDKCGRTALYLTALNNRRYGFNKSLSNNVKGEIAKLLLSRGANVNAQGKYGETTLYAAVENGQTKVVEALLEYNADVNLGTILDETPLHLSVRSRNEVICKMLLEKGANINAKIINGTTALHVAIYKEPVETDDRESCLVIIKILLDFGADVDWKDNFGNTALHFASEAGLNDIVSVLLNYGSDINIESTENHTPLDYAAFNIDRIANLLINYDVDYYNHDDYVEYNNWDMECFKILQKHIIMMKSANLYVSERNLSSTIDKWSNRHMFKMSEVQNDCEEEIGRMKSEKINGVSFYDILTKDINQLAVYVRNENIVQVLKSGYETKFPIYFDMIEANIKKGLTRKELQEQSNTFFNSLFNNFFGLPYNCTEQIWSYVSNNDLRIFLDACKPAHSSSTYISK